MALGATAYGIVRLVLGEASKLVAAGILLGVAAALALARLLTSLLYGVAPHDLGTFLVFPLLLAVHRPGGRRAAGLARRTPGSQSGPAGGIDRVSRRSLEAWPETQPDRG